MLSKVYRCEKYCRFGNFRENSIFASSIKRHISDVKNSRLRQDLPISINDRVILPIHERFIFKKLRIEKSSRENSRIYSTCIACLELYTSSVRASMCIQNCIGMAQLVDNE